MSAIILRSLRTLGHRLVLAVLVACAGPVVMMVGQTTVDGLVIDRETKKPISAACVTEVLDKGGFWTQPGKYLIGSACSGPDGKFRIPANPHRVMNASEPDSHPYFSVSADGYHNSLFIPTSETLSSGKLTISLVRSGGNVSN
jgi:hypothetical protein